MSSQYYADLHSHSTASDGSDAPARVVERAKEAGLKALALSDHDTIDGIPEAQEAGDRLGVEIIPATELTCYVNGREVHVLGYGINIHDEELAGHCRRFVEARNSRAYEIGRRLEEAGVPIDIEKVMSEADGGVVARPHIARALLEAGHVETMQEAFDKYLADGQPACVPKLQVTAKEVVDAIRQAGGIAVVAHPGFRDQFDLVPTLHEAGAAGVEVCHSAHDKEAQKRLEIIANERGLIKTGGSDCHGTIKGSDPLLGGWGIDEQRFQKLKKALKEVAGV